VPIAAYIDPVLVRIGIRTSLLIIKVSQENRKENNKLIEMRIQIGYHHIHFRILKFNFIHSKNKKTT